MEQRNLIMAVVASVTILLGWQFLYEQPRIAKEMAAREAAELEGVKNKAALDSQGATVPSPTPQPQTSLVVPGGRTQVPSAPIIGVPLKPVVPARASILGKTPRVEINSDRLTGSIQLKGGQFDDLILTKYRETIDKTSSPITLLSPTGAKNPYYAQFGWVTSNSNIKLPTSETLWVADRTALSPEQPLTMSWDNGQGIKFIRTISLDQNYMFSIQQ